MGLIDKLKKYLNEEESEIEEDFSLKEDFDLKEDFGFEEEFESKEASELKKEVVKTKRKKKKKISKKNQKKESYEESEVVAEIKSAKSDKDEQNTVKDFCEQYIDVSYHMEDMKREYKVVTEYLTDIQRIEELPINIAHDIMDTAGKIDMIDKNRQTYLQSENLLSMEQYKRIASYENDVLNTIKNLNEMEMRDSMLKNDLSYLEGEKEDLKFMRNEYSTRILALRGIIITILMIFMITSMALLTVALITKHNVTLPALIVGTVAVLAFTISYLSYINLKDDIKDADAKIKRAVSLLNKVKVKFINNTNTLDYIYEKYGVNSCKELEYQWVQYNTMVKDALKYSRANSDFKIYCDELVDKLTRIGIRDPLIWPKQVNALIDRREMVEIKHSLNTRRQKIREKLTTCEKIRDNAKTALNASMTLNPGMATYITEVLSSYNLRLEE